MRYIRLIILAIFLVSCSPSQAAIQAESIKATGGQQSASIIPVSEDTSVAIPTVAPTIIQSPTPENKVLDVDPLDILPVPDELPSGKYSLSEKFHALEYTNESLLNDDNKEAWKDVISQTGRETGWGVAYAGANRGVYMPGALGFYIQKYKTAEGAQLAVTKFNTVELFPDQGFSYVNKDTQIGDKSVAYRSVKIVPGGDNEVLYTLELSYKNIVIHVQAMGLERYIQPDFVESMAALVIKKIDPSYTVKTPVAVAKMKAGTYLVDSEIAPGLYVGHANESTGDFCSWERLKDLEKTNNSIIKSGFSARQFYVEVMKTDKALTTSCDIEPVTNLAKNPGDYPTKLDPGMYIIGKDIQAGVYKGEVATAKTDYCFWEQYAYPNEVYNLNSEAKSFTLKVSERNFALKTDCTLELVEPFKSNTNIKVTATPGAKPTATVKPSPTAKPTATAVQSLSDSQKIKDLNLEVIGINSRTTLKSILTVKQAGAVNTIAFSKDDKFLASGGDNKEIHVWDLENGTEAATLKGHKGPIRKLSFSEDGKWLASTGTGKEAILWSTSTWEESKTLDIKGNGVAVQFLPDGKLITVNDEGFVGFWDVEAGSMARDERVPTFINPACAGAKISSFSTDKSGDLMAAALSVD